LVFAARAALDAIRYNLIIEVRAYTLLMQLTGIDLNREQQDEHQETSISGRRTSRCLFVDRLAAAGALASRSSRT
jgi:hypothetical protein